jgi:AcrR family transcriptional regulator
MEAALKTLRTAGFAGTSARAIGRVGGFPPGLIYYYFDNLEALLLAAIDMTSSARLARYRDVLATANSVREVAEAAATLYREDLELGHVAAVQELIAGGSSSRQLRTEIPRRLEPWIELAEHQISRFIDRSSAAAFIPVHALAELVVALYVGLETISHLDRDHIKVDDLFGAGMLLAPMLDDLLSEEGPKA